MFFVSRIVSDPSSAFTETLAWPGDRTEPLDPDGLIFLEEKLNAFGQSQNTFLLLA